MRVAIEPGKAAGTVYAPPSKSMAHRMLMGAGLAEGTSVVANIELSEDMKATLGILKALGCKYEFKDKTVTIQGIGNTAVNACEVLDCKESGSTLRFFIPVLLTGGGKAEFSGAKRLFERPLNVYEDICREQGIFYEKGANSLVVEGQLKAAHFRVPGNISSQFITGLLYALPLLEEDSIVEVLPPVESKSYIHMTLEALAYYGIHIEQKGNRFYISGGQKYQAREAVVEGDYSNAAFLDSFNLLGGAVEVKGLRGNSLQGDQIYRAYFEELKKDHPVMDLAECPDLGPILMGLAGALGGARFTGTKRLKIKESDRGRVMAEELQKFGIRADVLEDEILVHPGRLSEPTEVLQSHNDHRIAMTLAVLCSITGGKIEGAEAVRKSFPEYYETLEKIGIKVTREV